MAIRSPRHSIALCLATGAVAAVGCWYVFSGPGQHRVVNALAPADALISATAHATDRSIVSNAGMPSPLAGSSVPRLPLDSRGHLARTRAVRDFFDYFLTAQSDETPTALDALVTHAIAMQLEGTMAQAEALDVWKRYRAYFDALAQSTGTGATPGDRLDPAALQLALDQRATLASRTLGEWSAPFFGAEQERQRYGLERLKIARDPSLNDAQKRERLTALEQLLPPEQRAEAARAQAQQDAVGAISQLQKQAATPDEMHAQIAQQLGPEVAMRALRRCRETTTRGRLSIATTQRSARRSTRSNLHRPSAMRRSLSCVRVSLPGQVNYSAQHPSTMGLKTRVDTIDIERSQHQIAGTVN